MYTVSNPKAFDEMPELGMGYHFGMVQSSEGEGVEGVIVLNARFALTSIEIRNADRFAAPPFAPERLVVPSNDVSLFKSSFGHLIANMSIYASRSVLHASPAFPLLTNSSELLVRFSAFSGDRRVSPDGSVLPGTYVTSERDAAFSPSGFAVVGRYAPPNMLPAVHRFDITVPARTAGLVGTVVPAFGQAGGGVEIELKDGAARGSVTGRSTIPEY